MPIPDGTDWRTYFNSQVDELIALRSSLTALGPLKETIDITDLETKLTLTKLTAVAQELDAIITHLS